jgi:hypothetical protein
VSNEITPSYIKGMIELYSTKGYNEFSDEELEKLEEIMCEDGEIMAPIEICDNSFLALSFGNHVRGIIARDLDNIIIEAMEVNDEG